jgi:hypothetical protein
MLEHGFSPPQACPTETGRLGEERAFLSGSCRPESRQASEIAPTASDLNILHFRGRYEFESACRYGKGETDGFQKNMGSSNGSVFCPDPVIVSDGADPEHHDHDDTESAGRTAVAEHDHHHHVAGHNPASEPDDSGDPYHNPVEASSPEDDTNNRQYNHKQHSGPAEQFEFEHYDHHHSGPAEQFEFEHYNHHYHTSSADVALDSLWHAWQAFDWLVR